MREIIHILIPTFDRPREFRRLMEQIDHEAGNWDGEIRITVLDDGSRALYADDYRFENVPHLKVKVLGNRTNNGKEGYYLTVTRLAGTIKTGGRSERPLYVMHLSDDLVISDHYKGRFFSTAIGRLNSCGPRACALNLLTDSRGIINQWTGIIPEQAHNDLWETGWVDGGFIAHGHLWSDLWYRVEIIPKSRWVKNPLLGSGVWMQVSNKLKARGWRMFHMEHGMLGHGDCESKMNPEERQINPLKTEL